MRLRLSDGSDIRPPSLSAHLCCKVFLFFSFQAMQAATSKVGLPDIPAWIAFYAFFPLRMFPLEFRPQGLYWFDFFTVNFNEVRTPFSPSGQAGCQSVISELPESLNLSNGTGAVGSVWWSLGQTNRYTVCIAVSPTRLSMNSIGNI